MKSIEKNGERKVAITNSMINKAKKTTSNSKMLHIGNSPHSRILMKLVKHRVKCTNALDGFPAIATTDLSLMIISQAVEKFNFVYDIDFDRYRQKWRG